MKTIKMFAVGAVGGMIIGGIVLLSSRIHEAKAETIRNQIGPIGTYQMACGNYTCIIIDTRDGSVLNRIHGI